MNTFTESQRFRQAWLWIGIGLVALIPSVGLLLTDEWDKPSGWLNALPPVLLIVLLYVWRLDTRLDAQGIHYRVFPILPWRTIPWTAIRSASVCEYDFVGYGIRWGFDGWVYNVAGNKGLRIVYPNNRQITIGTQHPNELAFFLDAHPTLITT